MKLRTHEAGNTGVIVIGVIAGLIIGFAGGEVVGNNMNDDDTKSSTTSSMSTDSADGVTVGGAKMVADKDIVDNAVNAKNVTTLVTAVKAADLVDTLKGSGPFTVFAPNNDAFAKLPAGTVETLVKPESKATLAGILTYHVVPGTYTTAALKAMAAKGETLTSVQGGTLKPVMVDNKLEIQDGKGNNVTIETPDVISSNGVTHVITSILMQ